MNNEADMNLISTEKWNHIISMIWLYFMLFPTGTIFNISIPLLLLFIFDRRNRYNEIMIPLLVLLVPTLFLNIGQPYMDFKSLVRLFSFALIFLTFASYKANRILFPYAFFAVCYILLSQVSIILNLPFLGNFFDSTYSITELAMENHSLNMANVETADLGLKTRLGGMYINPNNCASYLSVAYAVGLCEGNRETLKQKILFYVFIALTMISALITGSRTGFMVIAAISLYYLYAKGYRMALLFALFLPAIVVMMAVDLSDVRAFRVGDGMEGSFTIKMRLFIDYLSNNSNPIWWLFGAGDITVTNNIFGFGIDGTDFDFGNIFIEFGAIFYVMYILVCFRIFRTLSWPYRAIMFILLWSFSNSILISYRMCPVFFVALGLLYKRSYQEEETETEVEPCCP